MSQRLQLGVFSISSQSIMYFSGHVGDVYASDDGGWFETCHILYEFEGAAWTKSDFETVKENIRALSLGGFEDDPWEEWWEAVLHLEPEEEHGVSKNTLYAYRGILHLVDPLTMAQLRAKIGTDLVLKPQSSEHQVAINWVRRFYRKREDGGVDEVC